MESTGSPFDASVSTSASRLDSRRFATNPGALYRGTGPARPPSGASEDIMKIGDKIPDLRGKTGEGDEVRLRDLKGKSIVVYFYPKDSTPGCTLEAQDFRDLQKDFGKRGAVVLGVSRDSAKSHCNFKQKQSLNFDLIADTDETWCKAFDVIHEKTLYGRKFIGVVRSTFLIGPDGRLLHEWRNVKVPGHADVVLEAVRASSK